MRRDDSDWPKWLDEFGDKLEEAARTRSSKRRRGVANRRTAIASVAAVLVLSGFAFSTYYWNDSPPEPAPSAGIIADPGEPLSNSGAEAVDPNSAVDGGRLCELKGGASRDQRPRVIAPTASMRDSMSALSGVDTATVNRGEFTFEMNAVGPNQSSEDIPDTPECARFRHMPQPPPRVCLAETSDPNGGETCASIALIRSGRAFLVEDQIPGARKGTARIFGMAADGVDSVKLSFRGRPDKVDAVETVPVFDNVFALEYNGSAAVPPTVEMVSKRTG